MKRIVRIILGILACMAVIVCLGHEQPQISMAGEIDMQMDVDGWYLVDTYEELIHAAENPVVGRGYRLAADIIQTDSLNDNMIILSGPGKILRLDLNGYTLSRAARSIDDALFEVKDDAQLVLYDNSPTQTGACRFEAVAGDGYVIQQSGGCVTIYGGSYYLDGVATYGSVISTESGILDIYYGVFDARECDPGRDVSVIELIHFAYMYEVPHCNIYDGLFYATHNVFSVSSYGKYLSYGCLYPSVYVLGGEYYLTAYPNRSGGFAYCNNGWGQVIVAGGYVPSYSLNNDVTYLPQVYRQLEYNTISGDRKAYYWVTPPPMIGTFEMPLEERLLRSCMRTELEYYKNSKTIQEVYGDVIDELMNHPDGFVVDEYEDEFPWLWCTNYFTTDSIRWYFSDAAHYQGENTPWALLADYNDWFLPWHLDVRPEHQTFYMRAVVSREDGSEAEDVIMIQFEELVRFLQGTVTIGGDRVQYGNTVVAQLSDIPQWQSDAYTYEWTVDGKVVGTGSQFTIDKAAYVGKELQCIVKSTVHPGALSATPCQIEKADNDQYPQYHTAKYGNDYITLTNVALDQEYLFTVVDDISLLTEDDWDDALSINAQNAAYSPEYLGLNHMVGSTIYVYTRYKETSTAKAGSRVLCTPLLLGDVVPLKSLSFRELRNETIFIPFTFRGDTVTLEYDLNPVNANQWNNFYWRTSYPVSVKEPVSAVKPSNHTGTVTLELISTGTTNLTAYYITNTEVRYAMIQIVVYDPENYLIGPANMLSPLPDVTISEGQTYFCQLPEFYPELPEGTELTWYITKQDGIGAPLQKLTQNHVANIVPETGEIYGLGYGTTDITLFNPNGVALDTFKLSVTTWNGVLPAEKVYLNRTELTLKQREYFVLSASILPTNATNQTAAWSSSDPYVATVDAYGRVRALNPGTTQIRASVDDVYAECTVTVVKGDFTTIVETPDMCPKDATCPMFVYTDVDRNSWYHDGVHYCLEEGLMNGTSATTFAPDMATNRAMVVTILYRLEGSPAVGTSHPFTDLTADWYENAVIWAYTHGIVNGTSATTFAPDQVVTREQIATMLYRYAQYKGYNVSRRNDLSQFPDRNETSSWAAEAMQWAVAEGLVTGAVKDNQTVLLPQGEASRCQFATILYRFNQ